MEIVKSLNLNVTPKDAPNGSLVYARNVMTDDTSSFLTNDIGFDKVLDFKNGEYIVGVIPCNKEIVVFTYKPPVGASTVQGTSKIYRYSDNGVLTSVSSNWKWSGGKINGTYTYNYKNELIIAIAEYSDDNSLQVPLKSLNLNTCNEQDGYSYNLEENVPKVYCTHSIENKGHLVCGTYTFFVRFCLDEYNYTKWFQITPEIHILHLVTIENYSHSYKSKIGKEEQDTRITKTSELLVNDDRISDKAIKLEVTFDNNHFNKVQIGYIIKRESDVQGRVLNRYDIPKSGISAEKITVLVENNKFLQDISIDALLEEPNQKFNVKNIINYNNRLYIANYNEYNIENITLPSVDIEYETNSMSLDFEAANESPQSNDYIKYGFTVSIYDREKRVYRIPKTLSLKRDGDGFLIASSKDEFLEFLYNDIYFTPYNYPYIQKYYPNGKYININGKPGEVYNAARTLIIQNNLGHDCIKSWDFDGNVNDNIDSKAIVAAGWDYIYNSNEISIKIDTNNDIIFYIGQAPNEKEYNLRNSVLTLIYALPSFETMYGYWSLYLGNYAKWYYEYTDSHHEGDIDYLATPPSEFRSTVNLEKELYIDITGKESIETDSEGGIITSYNTRTLIPKQDYNLFIHFIRQDGSATLGYPIGKFKIETTADGEQVIPKVKTNGLSLEGYIGFFLSYEDVEVNVDNVILLARDGTLVLATNPEYVYDINIIGGHIIGKSGLNSDYNINLDSVDFIIDNLNCNRLKLSLPTGSAIDGHKFYLLRDENVNYNKRFKTLFRLTKNFYTVTEYVKDDGYLPGYYSNAPFFYYKKENQDDNLNSSFPFNSKLIIDPNILYVYDNEGNLTTYQVELIDDAIYSIYPLAAARIKENYIKSSVIFEYRQDDYDDAKLMFNCVVPPYKLHDFLELQPAYTAKPSKAFTNYRENITDIFDRRIARSNVISDESLVNGFREFEPTQYKNIIENKGKITNIVGIGLYFIVHTEYSIFIFDRSPKLSQYAQTEIPDTFAIDYQELMPTNEGYGGLLHREESIITKHGYYWYDETNKLIFSFEQGKPSIVSSAINNYIKQLPIVSCRFAEDIIHNRLLICFELDGQEYITLSYNFSTKQFISFHDYKFTHNYKTYNKSYLFDESTENRNKLFTFNDKKLANYDDLGIAIGIDSGERYNVGDDTNYAGQNPSIIDIIFNEEFEVPKVLNSINYVLSKFNHVQAVYLPQIFKEYNDRLFSGDFIKIYTDEVITDNIDVSDDKSTVNDMYVYDKPKWEKGKWNLNYFRDVYNKRSDISDEKSLVYGKYFVVRFVFKNDTNIRFKLDNVNVNTQIY